MSVAQTSDLRFTKHALVRYVERYIDRAAVERLRARGLGDGAILRSLAAPFGAQLASFRADVRTRAQRVLRSLAIARIPFRLKLGRMRLVVASGQCITVLPADRIAS